MSMMRPVWKPSVAVGLVAAGVSLAAGCGGPALAGIAVPAHARPAPTADVELFPPPVPGVGRAGSLKVCPNLEGVTPPSPTALQSVLSAYNQWLDAPTEQAQLALSDQTLWPTVRNQWGHSHRVVHPGARLTAINVQSVPAAQSLYARVIEARCGQETLALSWAIGSCSPRLSFADCERQAPALIGYAYLVDRRGHWLVWDVEGG
jgi:hypothetical protein